MTTTSGDLPPVQEPARDARNEKPEWAMSRRQRENARRRREGLKPLRPIWPWVLLGIVVLGGGGAWFYQTQIVPTMPVAEVVAAEPEVEVDSRMQINPFEYVELAPQTLQQVVRVTGTLQPSRQSQIASQTTGRVESVARRPGDSVAEGDLLVQVDVEQLQLQLDIARSNQRATQSQLSSAENNLLRVQALVDRGVSTATDLDSARTSVQGLEAQVAALGDQVAQAELSLTQASVVSPISGIVAARSVEPGQFVSTGTPLVTIVDLSTVELVAQAPVATGALIAPGQNVAVTVDGISGRVFEGEVVRINPIATEGARTIPVYVELANPDNVLLGGMFATGEIVVREATDAIGVPSEAIREDREGDYVLVVADGVLERRAVVTGESWRGDLVQVTEGLSSGDMIISAGLPEVAPGDSVVLVE